MRQNNQKQNGDDELRSLSNALNTPIDEVETLTDDQVIIYLREHGRDPEQLQRAFSERLEMINRTQTPKNTQVPTDETANSLATLKEHFDARGITVKQLEDAVNVPFGVALPLFRNTLESLPPKVINRVSSVLDIDPHDTAFMMRIPASTQVHTGLLRSNTGVTSLPTNHRTFREAMLQCKENGELTSEQELDWKEELLP